MKKEELIRGIKLIMLFDGWKLATHYTFDPKSNGGKNDYQVYEKKINSGTKISCRVENIEYETKYHKSWDSLMPVVQKFLRRYEEGDGKRMCEILRYALYYGNIDRVFQNLVFLIDHFNNTPPKPHANKLNANALHQVKENVS